MFENLGILNIGTYIIGVIFIILVRGRTHCMSLNPVRHSDIKRLPGRTGRIYR